MRVVSLVMDPPEENEEPVVDSADDVWAWWLVGSLLVVGAVSAWIALVPRVFSPFVYPGPSRTKMDIMALSNALDDHAIRHEGRYPESLDELLGEGGVPIAGQLRTTLPPDEWGRPYLLRAAPTDGFPCVYTYGRDGVLGGSGEDEDLSNLLLLGEGDSVP